MTEAVAYHEAGHAVAAVVLKPRAFRTVTIRPSDEWLGHVLHEPWEDDFQPDIGGEETERRMADDMTVSLAGPVAEARFTGVWNEEGAASDHEDALEFAWRLGGSSEGVAAVYQAAEDRARELIADRWPEVQAVARRLLERKELTAAEVEQIVGLAPREE